MDLSTQALSGTVRLGLHLFGTEAYGYEGDLISRGEMPERPGSGAHCSRAGRHSLRAGWAGSVGRAGQSEERPGRSYAPALEHVCIPCVFEVRCCGQREWGVCFRDV